jgi:hypothetical protein
VEVYRLNFWYLEEWNPIITHATKRGLVEYISQFTLSKVEQEKSLHTVGLEFWLQREYGNSAVQPNSNFHLPKHTNPSL